MADAGMTGCRLANLPKSFPDQLLPGLRRASPRLLEINSSFFPCCDGLGQVISLADQLTRHCHLQQRVQRLNYLLDIFCEFFHPDSLPEGMRPGVLERFESWVSDWRCDPTTTGHTVEAAKLGVPSFLWSFAMSAIWRFDAEVVFIPLGSRRGTREIDKVMSWPSQGRQPIVCVEQVDQIWKSDVVSDLELIIGTCSLRVWPMWLVLQKREQERPTKGSLKTKCFENFIDNMIRQEKSRSVFDFVDLASQSKLTEVSRGTEKLLRQLD